MTNFIYHNLDHVVAGMLLLARIGDIGTTFLATPTLKLEQNPIVKKLGWPFAILTLFLCLIPYYSIPIGVIGLVVSLMVSVSNSLGLWLVRSVGETQFHALLIKAAAQANLKHSLILLMLPVIFIVLLGISVMIIYPHPSKDWGFWFACGFFTYALVMAIYPTLAFLRMRRIGLANTGGDATKEL